MNALLPAPARSWLPSAVGREQMLAERGEPLFHADWIDVVFLHYETDPEALQRDVPWPLDLRDGRAFVSLVAFTLRDMRPRFGGKLGALLMKPIATHEFLNVRTYVRHENDAGIYFLAEWLPNKLSVALGPTLFGLPYRLGRIAYENKGAAGEVSGCITDARSGAVLSYHASLTGAAAHHPCEAGSLDEFVAERYTAFTTHRGLDRTFYIWHPPWPLASLDAHVDDHGLLALTGEWSRHARLMSAHHSPGYPGIWMGRPHLVSNNLAAL